MLFIIILIIILYYNNSNIELFSTITKYISLDYIIINPKTSKWNLDNIKQMNDSLKKLLNMIYIEHSIKSIKAHKILLPYFNCNSVRNTILDKIKKKNPYRLQVFLINKIPNNKRGCYYDNGIIILGWNSGSRFTNKPEKYIIPNKMRAETLAHEILHSGKLKHIYCRKGRHSKYHNNLMFSNNHRCQRDRYRTKLTKSQINSFISECPFLMSITR